MKKALIATLVIGSVLATGCGGVTTRDAAIGVGAAALTYGLTKHANKHHDKHDEYRRDEYRRDEYRDDTYHPHHHHHYQDEAPRYDAPNWER